MLAAGHVGQDNLDFMAVRLHFLPPRMVFEALLSYSRIRQVATDRPAPAKSRATFSAHALDGQSSDVYDEEAFQHFLGVERVRAQRSERPLLLLLVSLRKSPTMGAEVPRAVSPALFSCLGVCVREVDFVGWYREDQVAAAVLTQGLDLPDRDASSRIVARVTKILSERLPQPVSERLRIRVVRLGRFANS